MGRKPSNRPKHVPQRTCIACRRVAGKRALLRIVRTPQGVEIDLTGKKAGRGAYLHPNQRCWQAVLSGNRLGQALRTTLTPAEKAALVEYMSTLPPVEEDLDGDDAKAA
jgi:predicted RNA-binding protein YlxR (DUF448 family)